MHVFKDISSLKGYLSKQKKLEKSIGLVPTMGALHEGHSGLLKESFAENDITVCSIFVNPTQFNKTEDLKNYPRREDKDLEMLESIGCDVTFIPTLKEMYPTAAKVNFDFGKLAKYMEGEHRPGHFNGVALVVSKLFNIVLPNRAYFGQKDIQQFKIIEQLRDDLSFDIKLKSVVTVREADGLALSSRNKRLTNEGRKKASLINKVLLGLEKDIVDGAILTDMKSTAVNYLFENDVKVEYLELVRESDLSAVRNKIGEEQVVLCIAAVVDGIRLIDNRIF